MPLFLINLVLLFMFLYLLANIRVLQQYQVLPVLTAVAVNLVAEFTVFCINNMDTQNRSFWVYNFSLPIELVSYGLLYKRLFRGSRFLYFINASMVAIPLFTLLSFLLHKSIFLFNTGVAIYGCVFLLLTTLYFFIWLFQFDYFDENPLKQFFFWLSTGLLLCYLGSLTYLSNINYITTSTWLQAVLRSLNFILNCILYMCIFIAIACLKKYPDSQIQSS
jgi:hypothetical protein